MTNKEKNYEDWLNEQHKQIDICGILFFPAGTALKELDPSAFQRGCLEWTPKEEE